jgi:hypothetical protein
MSTYQVHARIAKKIINMDLERPNTCCWDDCSRDSTVLYRYRYHHHPASRPCATADATALAHGDPGAHQWFAFCSERHQAYFVSAGGWRALALVESTGRAYGNLPTGSKNLPL